MVFDRAVEHLDRLDAAIIAWEKYSAYVTIAECDLDAVATWDLPPRRDGSPPQGDTAGEVVFHERYPIPQNWALVVTETVHGFRASLDHLVYALAVAHSGELNDDIAEGLKFPIFWKSPLTNSARKKKIGALHPDAQAIIQGLQPYGPDKPPFQHHVLYVLHELDRITKHRLLIAAVGFHGGPAIGSITGPNFNLGLLESTQGHIEDGAVIARFIGNAIDSARPVNVEFRGKLQVVFSGQTMPVIETLRHIEQFVAWVFEQLEPFLTRHDDASPSKG